MDIEELIEELKKFDLHKKIKLSEPDTNEDIDYIYEDEDGVIYIVGK